MNLPICFLFWKNHCFLSDSFRIVNGQVKRVGELTERNEKYLKNFSALEPMHNTLQEDSGIFVYHLGKAVPAGEFSAKDILSWVWTANKIHSQTSLAVKTYLPGTRLGWGVPMRTKRHTGNFLRASTLLRPFTCEAWPALIFALKTNAPEKSGALLFRVEC